MSVVAESLAACRQIDKHGEIMPEDPYLERKPEAARVNWEYPRLLKTHSPPSVTHLFQ